ncbi:MAG: hypothetical protein ACXV2C_05390, partial [Candidatus Bathyarchaeia archaeon]
TAYWNKMKSAEPPKATAKPRKTSTFRKKTIAKTRRANMKADKNIESHIANFNCERLANYTALMLFFKQYYYKELSLFPKLLIYLVS